MKVRLQEAIATVRYALTTGQHSAAKDEARHALDVIQSALDEAALEEYERDEPTFKAEYQCRPWSPSSDGTEETRWRAMAADRAELEPPSMHKRPLDCPACGHVFSTSCDTCQNETDEQFTARLNRTSK